MSLLGRLATFPPVVLSLFLKRLAHGSSTPLGVQILCAGFRRQHFAELAHIQRVRLV